MTWRVSPDFAQKRRKRDVHGLVVTAMNDEFPKFIRLHGQKSKRHIRRAWRRQFGGLPTREIVEVVKEGGRVRFKS